jgi:hypothetical protein
MMRKLLTLLMFVLLAGAAFAAVKTGSELGGVTYATPNQGFQLSINEMGFCSKGATVTVKDPAGASTPLTTGLSCASGTCGSYYWPGGSAIGIYTITASCSDSGKTSTATVKVGYFSEGNADNKYTGGLRGGLDGKCESGKVYGCNLKKTFNQYCKLGETIAYKQDTKCGVWGDCGRRQTARTICEGKAPSSTIKPAFPPGTARGPDVVEEFGQAAYNVINDFSEPIVIVSFLLALAFCVLGAMKDAEGTKRLLKWN